MTAAAAYLPHPRGAPRWGLHAAGGVLTAFQAYAHNSGSKENFQRMPRPPHCRVVGRLPGADYFKPRGIPLSELEEVALGMDEFEAMRLADLEGMYQEQAAERMNVSRQTFGRIIESARRKVAEALVEGKALRIEGGAFEMRPTRTFACARCGHDCQVPQGTERPPECPACHSKDLHRAPEERGRGGGGAGGGCRGRGCHASPERT